MLLNLGDGGVCVASATGIDVSHPAFRVIDQQEMKALQRQALVIRELRPVDPRDAAMLGADLFGSGSIE